MEDCIDLSQCKRQSKFRSTLIIIWEHHTSPSVDK